MLTCLAPGQEVAAAGTPGAPWPLPSDFTFAHIVPPHGGCRGQDFLHGSSGLESQCPDVTEPNLGPLACTQ